MVSWKNGTKCSIPGWRRPSETDWYIGSSAAPGPNNSRHSVRKRLIASLPSGTSETGRRTSCLTLAPLRGVAAPYLDTLAIVPATALGDISGDPQDPTPGLGRAVLLDTFTEAAADAFVELAGPGSDTPITSLEIRHLGGALRSSTPDPGAAGPLDSEILIHAAGAAPTPEASVAIATWLETMSERLAPWVAARRTLLTFDEEEPGLRHSFTDATADRLARITARYDPGGLILANHIAD